MKIKINGQIKEVDGSKSIAALINELNLNADRIVVEYNGEVLDKSEYDSTYLNEGDVLELIQFVGGG
ncbi:sulfur carrier protein ThiS [Deferribacter thermophilus]|uniref:sulfur carrier protein ThiS n=1 Tax=Deferribacter thermophilus TaxID=53573 RepID=UPI003C145227